MRQITQLVKFSIVLALAGCSAPERSRNLNDASIPVRTTAMQVCSACHGMQGVSTSPNFPNLAAQTQPYLVKQLTDFKKHGRSDPPGFEYMWGISSHLTNEQINGLATYFSQLPPPSGNADKAGTPEMLKEGQTIYEQGIASAGIPACSSCHGAHAEGADQFPRLAGQHANYVVKQLEVYQRTEQRPDGVAMKAITHSLTPENMANVAAYLESISSASVTKN